MSVIPVVKSQIPSVGNQLQQQVLSNSVNSQDTPGTSGILGDLLTLSPVSQQDPQGLATALGSLQGNSAVYADASLLGSNSSLMTAFMNKQSSASNPAALLTILKNLGGASLFSYLDNSGAGSGSDSTALLG